MVVDDPARDEMFLDDPLEDRGITCAVPSTFWVHDGNRPAFADAQAVGLRAQDAALLVGFSWSQQRKIWRRATGTPMFAATSRWDSVTVKKYIQPRKEDRCGSRCCAS